MRTVLACLALSLLAACAATMPPRDDATPTNAPRVDAPGTPPVDAACDWRAQVLPGDRAAVEATADQAVARIPSTAGMPDYLGDDLKEASLGGTVLAHALLRRAREPLPLGDPSGAWQVRSIQASGDSVWDYPFFRAQIDRTDCGYDFHKTTGSQRRSGRLLPMADARALAFLGTATVNDNPVGPYDALNPALGEAVGSHGDKPVNSAGRLLRIGEKELLMILDLEERGFELYHLKR